MAPGDQDLEAGLWGLPHSPKNLLLFAVTALYLHDTVGGITTTEAGLFCIGTLSFIQKYHTRMCWYIPDTTWEPPLPQTLTFVPKEHGNNLYECQTTTMPLMIPLFTP